MTPGELGQLPVPPYRLGHLAGAAVAVGVTLLLTRRRDLELRRVVVLLGVLVLGVWTGARLGNVVANPDHYRQAPAEILTLRFVRLSLTGGLLGGLIVAVPGSRWLGLPTWKLGDLTAVAGGLGLACVRGGCFARGCCFGTPTELPWAVVHPPGSPAWTAEVARDPYSVLVSAEVEMPALHPTQLYEAAGALVAAAVAWLLLRRSAPPGVPILAAGSVFLLLRWSVWSVRSGGPLPVLDPRMMVLLAALGLAILLVARRERATAP